MRIGLYAILALILILTAGLFACEGTTSGGGGGDDAAVGGDGGGGDVAVPPEDGVAPPEDGVAPPIDGITPTPDGGGDVAVLVDGEEWDVPLPCCEDAGADTKGPDLTEEWIKGLCEEYCGVLAACAKPEGQDADCVDMCIGAVKGSGNELAKKACATSSDEPDCGELDWCMAQAEIPPVEGCEALCAAVKDCGYSSKFEIPEDPAACKAACDGTFSKAGDGAKEVVDCILAALNDDCDLGGVMVCVGGGDMCEDFCSDEEAAACAAEGTPIFESPEACAAMCGELSLMQQVASGMCVDMLSGQDCKQAKAWCLAPPEEPAVGCDAFCDVMVDLCPGEVPAGDMCLGFCTGITMAFPAADMEGSPECLSKLDTCPIDETGDEGPTGLFLCIIPPDPECVDACALITGCTDEIKLDECLFGCTQIKASQPEAWQQIGACLAAAGADCGKVMACLPEDAECDGCGSGGPNYSFQCEECPDKPLACECTTGPNAGKTFEVEGGSCGGPALATAAEANCAP